jgi:hypothetical protein
LDGFWHLWEQEELVGGCIISSWRLIDDGIENEMSERGVRRHIDSSASDVKTEEVDLLELKEILHLC